MHSHSFHCPSLDSLKEQAQKRQTPDLIQVYGSIPRHEAQAWASLLSQSFPNACCIGMSCERHICGGEIKNTGATVIFSYFEHTQLFHNSTPFIIDQAKDCGTALFSHLLEKASNHPNAFITLVDTSEFLPQEFFTYASEQNCMISGGRAGLFNAEDSWVMYQATVAQNQALTVGFINEDLQVQRDMFIDTVAIGRRMLVTSSEGRLLKRLDHLPAQQVYQRYLTNGEKITLPMISQFALQAVVDSLQINAVPVEMMADGALRMSEPLPEGEYVQFLYFNPFQSLYSAIPKIQELDKKLPESIFVFNCISRNDFQGEEPVESLRLINQVNAVSGPYCFGEFFSSQFGPNSLQHALTYIAISESAETKTSVNKSLQFFAHDDALTPILNLINNALQDIEQERESLAAYQREGTGNGWLYDLQTGLLNRFALLGRLQKNHDTTHLAVLRVRNFRLINQQYGYSAADDLLAQLANFIKRKLSAGSSNVSFFCYRLSANEIAISIHSQVSAKSMIRIFQQLVEDIENQDFLTSESVDSLLNLTLSVGLASACNDIGQPLCQQDHLLIKASEARRFAQINNRPLSWNGHLEQPENSCENLEWIQKIRRALENNEVFAYFQPCFDGKTGKQMGAEALLRVKIDGQIIGPFAFLDLIKQTQLYPKITQTMLAQCERVINTYPQARVALNLSVLDFKHDATLNALRAFFQRNKVEQRLTLEITESESIRDYQSINPILEEFRAAGALLAIDDFGAGYSNLEKLIALNPDILKLDGCLIKTIDQDEKLQKLVFNINNLAHSLGIKTQAEFVHNQAVMDQLVDMNVDYLQGFHLSEPISEEEWVRSLQS